MKYFFNVASLPEGNHKQFWIRYSSLSLFSDEKTTNIEANPQNYSWVPKATPGGPPLRPVDAQQGVQAPPPKVTYFQRNQQSLQQYEKLLISAPVTMSFPHLSSHSHSRLSQQPLTSFISNLPSSMPVPNATTTLSPPSKSSSDESFSFSRSG